VCICYVVYPFDRESSLNYRFTGFNQADKNNNILDFN